MIAAVAAEHLVHEAQRLRLHFEHRGTHDDHVAHQSLASITDALVDGGHAALGLAQVLGRHAHHGAQVPGGLVELAHVPHDIHVPHVVAVPLVDEAAVGDADVFHAASLTVSAPHPSLPFGWDAAPSRSAAPRRRTPPPRTP